MNIDTVIEEHIKVLEEKSALLKEHMDSFFNNPEASKLSFQDKFMTDVLDFIRAGNAEMPAELLFFPNAFKQFGIKLAVVTSDVSEHYQNLWYQLK